MKETKTSTTNISTQINVAPRPVHQTDIEHDYDYFQAQKVVENMLELGLISLSEFNKLSQCQGRMVNDLKRRAKIDPIAGSSNASFLAADYSSAGISTGGVV